ncbi:MAG: class I SAM-dependent methyltransferase [Planctomycetes bacterium]|nr:class I SAM-dependent methyltransferase [Planctomycetota bacterium]
MKQPVERSGQEIACPLCQSPSFKPWAVENGFCCVRCDGCGLLYVNPRPRQEDIDRGVQLGVHETERKLNVVGKRMAWKVRQACSIIQSEYGDWIIRGTPVRWLDVGAGFGEFVEGAKSVLPSGSTVEGIEPMIPKAEDARARGVQVKTGLLEDVQGTYDAISLIDVFSHLPDFRGFMKSLRGLLSPGGEVFLKTGNAADLLKREEFPGPLTLPDHLMFGGVSQISRFVEDAGFSVVRLSQHRLDGIGYSLRNYARKLFGHPVAVGLPYCSKARVLYVRARLRSS